MADITALGNHRLPLWLRSRSADGEGRGLRTSVCRCPRMNVERDNREVLGALDLPPEADDAPVTLVFLSQ